MIASISAFLNGGAGTYHHLGYGSEYDPRKILMVWLMDDSFGPSGFRIMGIVLCDILERVPVLHLLRHADVLWWDEHMYHSQLIVREFPQDGEHAADECRK